MNILNYTGIQVMPMLVNLNHTGFVNNIISGLLIDEIFLNTL